MLHPTEEIEGIAREIHEATGALLPVDAFELAELCGLETRPWTRSHGALSGQTIRYPARARLERQHGVVAHELGHFAQARAGLEDCEASARYLAGALMLPRSPFRRDMAATDWDLFALRNLHPNASAEMIIVRMTQLSPATAWVWDCGRVTRTYGLPADAPLELIDAAITRELPAELDGARAWPVIDGSFRRVLAVRRAA